LFEICKQNATAFGWLCRVSIKRERPPPTTGAFSPLQPKDFVMSLKRAVTAAAVLFLAVPAIASAGPSLIKDDPGTDGVIIQGSNLVTLVAGQDAPGVISSRFTDSPVPLFYESDSGVSADAPGEFAIHTNGYVYSYDGNSFDQTSAPVRSGAGTVANPWVVNSSFGTKMFDVSQQVRHVDGSRSLRLTWTVTNTAPGPEDFSAFWATDLYVSGSDRGTGAMLAGPPRTLQGIAVDGTKVGLVELTPWSHYYEGWYGTATDPTEDAKATYDDTYNPDRVDNGFGVEWDVRGLAPHASRTFVLGLSAAEPGETPTPGAPRISPAPPKLTSGTATFRFVGDKVTASFECSIDGGQFDPCSSPARFTGLAPGSHTFRVHGLNVDGDAGPAAAATWTVRAAPRERAGLVLHRANVVAGSHVSLGCSLAVGKVAECAVTLIGPKGGVIGHGSQRFAGAHRRHAVDVRVDLTAAARRLAGQLGGMRVVAHASVTPVGKNEPLTASSATRIVTRTVDATPGALQFASGSAHLLPGSLSYLESLASRLAGAAHATAIGYTDNQGSPQANYRLGLARAQTVCGVIERLGHVACSAVSFGQTHPRATNRTAAGRALNRRVELRLSY
jgi:outer membrane protein OmpA-like peptidoglycan-associated protein